MYDMLLDVPFVRIQSVEAAVPSLHGARSTDDNPKNWPAPEPIFLIYISSGNNGWIYRHMYAEHVQNHQDMVNHLYDLAKRNVNSPYRVGNSLLNLTWQRPCHFYLVLDINRSEFIDVDAPQFDGLQFKPEKPILRPGPVTTKYYDENRSFYDGYVTSVGGRSAFRCINYIKDEQGNDIKHPRVRTYCLVFAYRAQDERGVWNLHTIDPDGQNQGPPSPVPELELLPV